MEFQARMKGSVVDIVIVASREVSRMTKLYRLLKLDGFVRTEASGI